MYQKVKVALPNGPLGPNRCFEMGFSHHGDVRLAFWDGQLNYDKDDAPKNKRLFALSHGSELPLLASLVGYYARLGVSHDTTRSDFLGAAQQLLTDPDFADVSYRSDSNTRYLMRQAAGRPMPRFDNVVMGWTCLQVPIPCQPGVGSEVGENGIYTRTDIFGNDLLLLAHIPSDLSVSYALLQGKTFQPAIAELSQSDIPTVAQVICNQSMGEYRRNIYDFMHEMFGDEPADVTSTLSNITG